MNSPGSRLRTFAAGWCCRETMERVVDPLIADLQREHAEAHRSGRVWKSRWVHVEAWIAFVKVMAICAATSLTSLEAWTPDDRRYLTRAALISAVTTVVATALLVFRTDNYPTVLLHPSPRRFLFLVPYPFIAGVVLGLTLGIVLGLGGRAISRRLAATVVGIALLCSAVVFVDVGWIAPVANVAYRMTIGDSDPTPSFGEQSLADLGRNIRQFDRDPAFASFGFPAGLSFDFHRRVALSFSPVVFTLFALAAAGCVRRRWVLGIAAFVTFAGYVWLVIVATPWRLQPWDTWSPFAAAWLPNAAIAALAAAAGALSTRRHLA
jgi:hypothetical protein